MSDTEKVVRCEYYHNWKEANGQIACIKCGHLPTAKEIKSAEAIIHLRGILNPGDTVYTVLRSVSRSGMSRNIDLYSIRDNEPRWISAYVGHAIGSPQSRKNWEKSLGLTVSGCGMDMGFHLVYSLSRVLFRDGFAPSTRAIRPLDGKLVNVDIGRGKNAGPMQKEETTELTAKGWQFEGGRNGGKSGWGNDGGYALNHKWL